MSPSLIQPSIHDLEDPSHVLLWSQALRCLKGEDISTSVQATNQLFCHEMPPWCSPPIRWLEGLWCLWDAFLEGLVAASCQYQVAFHPASLPATSGPTTCLASSPHTPLSRTRWCIQHEVSFPTVPSTP